MAEIDDFIAEQVVEAARRKAERQAKEDARRAALAAVGATRLQALRDAIPARMRPYVDYRNGRAKVTLPGCAEFVVTVDGDAIVAVFPAAGDAPVQAIAVDGDLTEVIALAKSRGARVTKR